MFICKTKFLKYTLHLQLSQIFKMSSRKLSGKRNYEDYEGFKRLVDTAKNIVVLTGAGISAESGIPVFRGAGGLWRKYKSENLASPDAFASNPALVWEFYNYRRHIAFNASPNKAHISLADYEKKCKKENRNLSIVTQNVDGLHLRAGSEKVVELHGALRKVSCTNGTCENVEENYDDPIVPAFANRGDASLDQADLPVIDRKDLPKCKKCGSLARPYIVWFGEMLDPDVLEEAQLLVGGCDLCLVIGTSSVVYPAAMFAPSVAQRGVPVAEFNLEEHPADSDFAFHFPGLCATTLPKALGLQ
ncbi:NAD-dependent protein deacylase [Agrilus planipennis]|uniref:NAD-dependent protein deacylase n=1 Tax=Agrilus planipennis TaxID=224129 RepID=A0A1W4X6U7_AGRPL|nr:NAD-dependent protein deacylase [Agrilus planipennis]